MIGSCHFILDEHLCVKEISEESSFMLGSDVNTLNKRKLSELISPKSKKVYRQILRWHQQSDEIKLETGFKILVDSEEQDVIANFFRLDSQRVLCHFQLLNRSQFSSSLGSGESLWTAFSQTLNCGILNTDSDLRIRNISDRFIQILSIEDKRGVLYSNNALIGRPLSDFLNSDEQKSEILPRLASLVEKATVERFSVKSDIFRFRKLHLQLACGPIIISGQIDGYGLYLYDLTDRIEQENEIEESRAHVSELARLSSLGEMAGGIAHEINNPLAVILGATIILRKLVTREPIVKENIVKQVENIETMGQRISSIVKSMRKVSRNSSKDAFKTLTWSKLIDEVRPLADIRLSKGKVPLEISLQEGIESMEIQSQGVQLSQVLINLINNAADAVAEMSNAWVKLSIELNDEDRFFYARVMDSGHGISNEALDKIFDPFFTTKEVGSGTGLGLSISKRIAMNHGGDLYYEAGENTCFCLKLPKQVPAEILARANAN